MKQIKTDIVKELLLSPEFKKWVLSPSEESNYFWNNWMNKGELEREAVQTAREAILLIRFDNAKLDEENKDKLLKNIITRTVKSNKSQSSYSSNWLRYAASVALVLIAAFGIYALLNYADISFKQEMAEVEIKKYVKINPRGQKSVILLPDGSKVNLNSSSSITYYSNYNESRFLELKGEAFFQVAKDTTSPFVVKSANVFTTALGTAFNINTNLSELEIILVEGKVKVEEEEGNYQMLLPNQRVIFNETTGISQPTQIDAEKKVLWTEGILEFNNKDLHQVAEELEEWYDVEISLKPTHHKLKFSGRFEKEPLVNVLQSISFSLGIEYSMENKKVTFK
ncbi:FecR family protein [Marinigracilibium pacificum]|uniref:DUF4974 domain-containing protein n=1 Tax=Marinigracilibium pacificum TaxID=2729599 RepID=A0A848J2H2_9BACT|nr:FecR domain-containing protein [Marinigracilibium pacificum]NMM48740.1 DUF4974 domain-containing protein [Marinigracilibium pacificum]